MGQLYAHLETLNLRCVRRISGSMAGLHRVLTQHNILRPSHGFFSSIALLVSGLFLCAVLINASAFAQIQQSSRIELSAPDKRVYLAPLMKRIENSENNTSTEWAQEAYDSAPPPPTDSNIIAFGTNPAPSWLGVMITNATDRQDWVLDFGTLFEGRFGALTRLKILNADTNETYIDWHASRGKRLSPNIKVTLSPNKTELILIALEHNGFLPAQIVPSIMPQDTATQMRPATYVSYGIMALLLVMIGFFLPFAVIKNKRTYLSYAAYLAGALGTLFFLEHLTLLGGGFCENIPLLFLSLAGIGYVLIATFADKKNIAYTLVSISLISLSTLFIFIPVPVIKNIQAGMYILTILVSFLIINLDFRRKTNAEIVREATPYYYGFYGLAAGSLIMSALTYATSSFNAPWAANFYFYSLLPQMILLGLAVKKHVLHSDKREREDLSRKQRSNQALARLQQSKDAADQARLLRVIERERELMGDLREQESQRAEEMRRAKEEADAANAAKSAFLAVVSHEIRTPMNGIMGILKLLQDTGPTKEQSDFLLTMQKTGDTMVALLNDILDFEKIENGSMELEHINIDLHNMAKGIITLMTGYIKGKNVQLLSEISPDVPRYVMGDPTRLQQVLFNLVSNALKFTDEGSVTIKLEKGENTLGAANTHAIKFSVTDTGIGISPEAQKTLFQPFKQAETSTARKYGGTGLGLAICMRLIQNMGSKIEIHSEVGQGTTFTFTLAMDEGYGETATDSTQSAATPAQAIDPLDIVVIEDNEINRKVLQSLLEKDGHKVIVFASAEEALDKLEAMHPDIIFTDINLLGISGLEATRKIRQMDHVPHIQNLPIIGLTGNVSPQDLEDMRAAGLNGSIAKPIDYSKVQDILAQIKPADKPKDPPPPQAETHSVTAPVPPSAQPEEPEEPEQKESPAMPDQTPVTPAAAGALSADHYDMAMLQSLLDSLGKDTLVDLVEGCLQQTDTIIDALQAPDKQSDQDFVYARMHELKGMTYNFGLKHIGDLARDGEAAAKEGNLDTAMQMVEALGNARAQTRSDIESWVKAQS